MKEEIKQKEIVQFVSAKSYVDEDMSLPDEEVNQIFFCLYGKREVVVLCSDELKEILRNLPSEYIQPRLQDIKAYLDSINIEYVENFKGTTFV